MRRSMAPGVRNFKRTRVFGDQIENVELKTNIKPDLQSLLSSLSPSRSVPGITSSAELSYTAPVNNIEQTSTSIKMPSKQTSIPKKISLNQSTASADEIPKGILSFNGFDIYIYI